MEKITKARAIQLWHAGIPFWMTPCNMRPECGNLIDPKKVNHDYTSFNALYNTFLYYNCDNCRGRYPHFYTAD